jgi:hypothetical protein
MSQRLQAGRLAKLSQSLRLFKILTKTDKFFFWQKQTAKVPQPPESL